MLKFSGVEGIDLRPCCTQNILKSRKVEDIWLEELEELKKCYRDVLSKVVKTEKKVNTEKKRSNKKK